MADNNPHGSNEINHFGDLIGLKFTELDNGVSHCNLDLNGSHLNLHGVVHGGVMYSLADTGMGAALFSSLDPGQRCATLEIKISYFHFVTSGTLTCHSKVLQKSRRFGFLESDVFNGERIVARATGTFAILGAERE